jgi:hypothetical protein
MNVSAGYERSSTNGRVQGFDFCIKDQLELTPCPMPRKTDSIVKHNYFLSDKLPQTFNNRSSTARGE